MLDSILSRTRYEGIYYAVHSLHNALIVHATADDVVQTLTRFSAISETIPNYYALELCYALHIYHVLYYYRKLRFDDYLHHILMIGVALPIGGSLPAGTLLSYSLFFTTGLPGGIDYLLLFLTRNNIINKYTEKIINTWLNVWIRSPGCASHAAFTLAYLSQQMNMSNMQHMGGILVALLNYWNGQYFMQQVVLNAGKVGLYIMD